MTAAFHPRNILSVLRERLRFLRGNVSLIIAWPLMALLLSTAGWIVLLDSLDRSRLAFERDALNDVVAFSRGYASRLSRSLEAVDQIMLHLRHEWLLSGKTLRLDEMRRTGLLVPSFLFNAAIIDRDAEVATAASTVANPLQIGDQPYFVTQKFADRDAMYIGDTTQNGTPGQGVLQFSRRILDKEGKFDGVVVISVRPDYFVANFDQSIYGRFGFLGIVGKDYSIRVSRIGDRLYSAQGQVLTTAPVFPAASGSMLMPGEDWFSDRRTRYTGWHPVEGYPLIAMVGLDARTALAAYTANRASSIRSALWASLAVAAFTVITMTLSMRLAWRKYRMELIQATYRMATEGSREGFILVRPMRDRSGTITDFQILDCNHRGAEIVSQRREDIVGKKVTSFLQRPYLDAALAVLRRAHDAGFYEEDLQQPRNGPIAARWIHLKAVQAAGDLALTVRDISDSKAHVAELERRGNEDALTGLPNRHWVQGYLPDAIVRAQQNHTMLAVLFIDLDGFKTINDSLGHPVGDELLRAAGRRLKVAVRPHDHVARLGGDEFVVILEQLEHNSDVAHVADRILHAFREGFRLSQGVHSVGTSIGISVYPVDGADADTLLQNADIAMYAVKTRGKRNYQFYEARFYDALRARLERENELRHAIGCDQFVMYYQPRTDMASGEISSLEALVRWQHPVFGIVEPSDFIPLAEETGLILELGELIIDKVCAQLAEWKRGDRQMSPVSINVSPRQFNHGDVDRIIGLALARHQIDPQMVEIELTESSMMGDDQKVHRALLAIQDLGIKILVDDFGTGYSSLSQLQTLDFDVLKVDQAFTARIEKTDQGKVFFKAIVTMAHALGMRVVAEGVENGGQVAILRSLQCDEIQGYYVAPPMPADELQKILAARRA